MPRAQRPTRSPHPGVKVMSRRYDGNRVTWRARWTDPATGKPQQQSLDRLGLTTREARKAWAMSKARVIAEERAALAAGERLPTRTPPAKAVADYLDRCERTLRPRTVGGYRDSLSEFIAWSDAEGVAAVEDLAAPALARLRDFIAAMPYRAAVRHGRQGERAPSDRRRSPITINVRLRDVGIMLRDWRRRGLLPKLDNDAIADAMRRLRADKPAVDFLATADLRRLLGACLRHDAERYELTRAEKAGHAEPGTTARYEPVAPFVLACLLGGFRFGEAEALQWDWLDLNGNPPAVVLPPSDVKTREGRRVHLDVSPTLARLLGVLKLRADGAHRVFPHMTHNAGKAAIGRLKRYDMKRAWTWQTLRRTCATYSVNAAGMWGTASAFVAAKRLGHSVVVAESRYARLVNVEPTARTLEDAMGIADLAERVIAAAQGVPAETLSDACAS